MSVTECVNCGWKRAATIMTHAEYVEANRMTAWLCARPATGPLESVMPPRPANAGPVFSEDGATVIGYAGRP